MSATDESALDQVPAAPVRFWEMLAPDEQSALTAIGSRHSHPAGTLLLREGDASASVLVLLAGRVKVITASVRGYRSILAIRGPGDLLGEMAAIDRQPRMASVIAIDPVTVLRLPLSGFDHVMSTRPVIANAVLKVVSGRLRADNRRQSEFADITVAQRLDLYLADLLAHHGSVYEDGVAITVPFSQEEIASAIGASREAVVRALRALREAGIVSTNRQRIVILSPDALGQRARDIQV